jgi:hypothetical protein
MNQDLALPISYPYAHGPASGEILEVAPGVLWVRMPMPFKLDHINVWLIEAIINISWMTQVFLL